MRLTYVARSFLDYRIPVFEALSDRLSGRFRVIYSADYVPSRVHDRALATLGESAIGMRGEKRIGPNNFSGFSNSEYRIVYQPGLMRAIRQSEPTVMVGDGFFQWTSFALAYKVRHGVPLAMCYERTHHTERNAGWLRTKYRRAATKMIDAICCSGSLCVDYAEGLGMPRERMTTGHMVADAESLKREAASTTTSECDRLRKSWGNPELALICVGRLIQLKGVSQLLRSWRKVEQLLGGRVCLVIVGGGPCEDELRSYCQQEDLGGVVFSGEVDYREIAQFYAAADALVVPTLEDNWSLVVPEAMACGLPILCSIYNGCHPELIEVDRNGWTFDCLDGDATCHALEKVWAARDRLPDMGRRSKEIIERYTAETAADGILEACAIAVSRQSGPAL